MKKVLPYLLAAIVAAILCTVCYVSADGFDWFDTNWRFDTAQIAMPDGTVVQGRVDSYSDFAYSDTLQLTIDGVTYLTHAANVVLMKNK